MSKLLITASLAAVAAATPALAQGDAPSTTPAATASDNAGEGGGLIDIVVTAQRREGRLQTVPISVSAFDQARLTDLQINRTIDLQRSVPSLTAVQGTIDPATLSIFMRGAGQNAGTFALSESAVGLYVDDTYFARLTGANLDLADLERIEVLRGPQGTLYGRNTLVGAIRYITRKPGDTPFGKLEGEYGSYNLVRLKGTVSSPLSKDWAALATGSYFHRRGFTNAIARNDPHSGDIDEYGGRAAIAYIGDSAFKLNASAFYSHSKNQGSQVIATDPVTLRPAVSEFYANVSPADTFGRNRTWGSDLMLGWQGEGIEIKSISAYINSRQRTQADVSGGRPTLGPGGAYLLGFDIISTGFNHHQISQELQAIGDLADGKLTYIAGLYYFNEVASQYRSDLVLAAIRVLPQTTRGTTNSYAAFAELTYNVSDRLGLTAGMRYTEEHKKVTGQTQASLASPVYAPINARTEANATTPKFGVNFKASDQLFLYASASRGFQSGGFNYAALANPSVFQTPFGPQTVWTYEVGFKSDFLDRRARLNIAAYRNDFSNIQTNVTNLAGSVLTQNAGTARVQGIEAEAQLKPVTGLTLFASGAYSRDKYLKINPASDPARTGARRLPNVPRWQFDLGFNSAFALGAGDGRLLVGADYSHVDFRFIGAINAPVQGLPGYDLTNAYVGYRLPGGRWEARVTAENLFDKKYFVYGNVIGGFGVRGPGLPRIVRASIKYSY